MTGLTLTTRPIEHGVVLQLSGELDHHTAPRVLETLKRITLTAGQQLVVDLSRLSFCDSSGIASLVAARNHALAADATIALAALPAWLTRVFRMVGLDKVLVTYPTTQAAAAAWSRRLR
ncbi:STAS domain-containing protein [Planomonospora sp. ID67723]|uniref:STAS domain-containing protein n=1 Tax=Planomonospora sp. ID67723 TaxID=2738134 RepID=UPI0018C3BC53|nr:STAS domain-containing protein [Planomonospora sp. ID67723]MBG0831358.1 STAS domain-containing protein [Planomonospora sp. ID67723]